jgi:hypothetical protein
MANPFTCQVPVGGDVASTVALTRTPKIFPVVSTWG